MASAEAAHVGRAVDTAAMIGSSDMLGVMQGVRRGVVSGLRGSA